jgi:hypothetical protein
VYTEVEGLTKGLLLRLRCATVPVPGVHSTVEGLISMKENNQFEYRTIINSK